MMKLSHGKWGMEIQILYIFADQGSITLFGLQGMLKWTNTKSFF